MRESGEGCVGRDGRRCRMRLLLTQFGILGLEWGLDCCSEQLCCRAPLQRCGTVRRCCPLGIVGTICWEVLGFLQDERAPNRRTPAYSEDSLRHPRQWVALWKKRTHSLYRDHV